jgi:hypothetical protein
MLYRVYYYSRQTGRIFVSQDIEAPDDITAVATASRLATEKDAKFEIWDDRRLVYSE